MISISPIHKIVSFKKAKNMERKESYKSCGTISGSSDVEYQALLAELKQKDKQREELLMNLKVCLNFIYLQYLNRLAQFSSKLALCICSFPVKTCLPLFVLRLHQTCLLSACSNFFEFFQTYVILSIISEHYTLNLKVVFLYQPGLK